MILSILFSITIALAGEGHGAHEEHDAHEAPESFKISAEAAQSFALKLLPITAKTFEIPATALVTVKDFKGIYRQRAGEFARIPAHIVSRKNNTVVVSIDDFKIQDQVVIAGTGFLRTFELTQEEGISHGHSH